MSGSDALYRGRGVGGGGVGGWGVWDGSSRLLTGMVLRVTNAYACFPTFSNNEERIHGMTLLEDGGSVFKDLQLEEVCELGQLLGRHVQREGSAEEVVCARRQRTRLGIAEVAIAAAVPSESE